MRHHHRRPDPLQQGGDAIAAPGAVGAVTSVLSIDFAAPAAAPLARCVATPVDAVFMTRDTLVLATVRSRAI
jgi:hypothetical protein